MFEGDKEASLLKIAKPTLIKARDHFLWILKKIGHIEPQSNKACRWPSSKEDAPNPRQRAPSQKRGKKALAR